MIVTIKPIYWKILTYQIT